MPRLCARRIALPSLLALVAYSGYMAPRYKDMGGSGVVSALSTCAMAAPALVAARRGLGPRRTIALTGSLSALGFAVECAGVTTGVPYGRFGYGDRLGPRLFGLVPYTLPVSWVPLVLGAVAATQAETSVRSSLGRVGGAAALMVLIDGVLDPGAVYMGLWRWERRGRYYGVPASNYAGWALSSVAAVSLTVRLVGEDTRVPPLTVDTALLSLAFWSGVGISAGYRFPPALGAALMAYLLRRRAAMDSHSGARPSRYLA